MAEKEDQVPLDVVEQNDTEVEVKEPEQKELALEPQTDDVKEDQFDKAESATQKRIDKLTRKMREAERREQEAIKYAQNVKSENDNIKNRLNSLDQHYVSEYSTRVASQIAEAEKELEKAMELSDSKAVVEAQRKITALAIENDRANQAKMQQERQRKQEEMMAQQPVQQNQVAQQPRRPDPKAEQWATKNEWFGQDEAMTYAAFGIHKKLVEQEGFDPQTDEYYNELDRQMAETFPQRLNGGSKRPVQTVASVSRTTGRTNRKVRLSPSQVAIAKKLGVPLEEYAKYVKE